ncbi:3'(2'),5'-bisphosphate nucleotidase CysQ [Marinicella meishanensis]|uniref:3'(2'),5'-bisphosphate nucleotidase CysQ n=1 Tax=Marinicella meishanensis TaxID=2873263 RepID=UPI001CC0E59E|nr:3'(2'),5'-bisphosphate nucleotidase CysQ [Marinicella sp. NBU2979]
MNELLKGIEELAVQAGEAILTVYHSDDFGVDHKADDSPLTKADLAAHRVIVDGLQALTPDIPVLSEESADIPFEERQSWHKYWLVDPLDGTKEFIKRNGEFTVNIALIENGKSILSVVHVPVSNVSYSAAVGVGVFKRETGKKSSIGVMKNSRFKPTVVGSRSHMSEDVQAYLTRLGQHELVSMGSSLKFCLVAEGKADLYPRLGLTSEWDTAAAQCIVEQAGGQVVTLDGKPLLYNTKDSLLNPFFMVYGDPSRDWVNI